VRNTKEIETILDTLVAELVILRALVTEETLTASSEGGVPYALVRFTSHMIVAGRSIKLMKGFISQLNNPH
jgi:hypothetical protein